MFICANYIKRQLSTIKIMDHSYQTETFVLVEEGPCTLNYSTQVAQSGVVQIQNTCNNNEGDAQTSRSSVIPLSRMEDLSESPQNQPYFQQMTSGDSSMIRKRKKRRRILYNSCIACNETFVDKPCPVEEGRKLLQTFCKILNVPCTECVTETNPLCAKCCESIDEYLRLQEKVQEMIGMMEELRRLLGKKVVETYSKTVTSRKNYDVKSKIHDVWQQTLKSPLVPVIFRFQPTARVMIEGKNECNQSAESTYSLLDISNQEKPAVVQVDQICNEQPPPSPMTLHFDDDDNDNDLQNEDIAESDPETSLVSDTSNSKNTGQTQDNVGQETFVIPTLTERPLIKKKPDARKNRPIVVTKNRYHGCKYCGKVFPSNFSLQMHERIHTGERPFSCSICGKGCISKGDLKKHELTHDKSRYQGEPQFSCDLCDRKYHLAQSLYIHKRDHQGIHRYKPANPNDPTSSLRVVRKYVRKPVQRDEHGIPIPEPPKLKKKPGPAPKKPKFIGPRRLKRKRINGESLDVTCDICGKSFYRPYKLREHYNTHTGERPHKCDKCDSAFKSYSQLCSHRHMHDPDVVAGAPVKVCEHCGIECFTASSYYNHKSRHHSGKVKKRHASQLNSVVWKCMKCPKEKRQVYKSKKSLSLHMKKHHGKNIEQVTSGISSSSEHDNEEESTGTTHSATTQSNRRQSRVYRGNLRKLVQEPDNEVEEAPAQDSVPKRVARKIVDKYMKSGAIHRTDDVKKTHASNIKVKANECSSKLTDSYISKVLGGREIRIVLTRIDSTTSSDDAHTTQDVCRNEPFNNTMKCNENVKDYADESPNRFEKKPVISFPKFPVIIHNPLARNKDTQPIVITTIKNVSKHDEAK